MDKKNYVLLLVLTIVIKPFFTRLVFPFCEPGLRCRINVDRIDQHILSPLHHFESYFIIALILSFVFWYFDKLSYSKIINTIPIKKNKINIIIKTLKKINFKIYQKICNTQKPVFATKKKDIKVKEIVNAENTSKINEDKKVKNYNDESVASFFKVSMVLLGLLLAIDLVFGYSGTGFMTFIFLTVISLILGFIIQLFSSKWNTVGTAKNWMLLWCVSAIINIIILLKFRL